MRRHPFTRILSSTLACLIALYSLPPRVEAPAILPRVSNPKPDLGMQARQFFGQFSLTGPLAKLQHQLWHVGEHVQAGLDRLAALSLTTPLAIADHQHQDLAPEANRSDFQPTSNYRSIFTLPPDIPPRNAEGKYKVLNWWGGEEWWDPPPAPTIHDQKHVIVDANGKNAQHVTYINSYFSEHDGSGRGVFLAHFNGADHLHPRVLIQRNGSSLHLEQGGTNWGGYENKWRDWRSRKEFTGSGMGNENEPKWNYDGVMLSLRQHPYWRYDGYRSSLDHAKNFAYDAAVRKRYAYYYWETNPYVVAQLNQAIATRAESTFKKGRPAPVKGFWVELHPFPAFSLAGLPDYPATDEAIELAFPWPYSNVNHGKKWSKLTFYRPYVPDYAFGFLNRKDAADNPQDHDEVADYVCVGAFAAYDENDPAIQAAVAKARTQIRAVRLINPLPSGVTAGQVQDVVSKLPPDAVEKLIEAKEAGGLEAESADEALANIVKWGIEQGIVRSTFTASTDPTQPGGEPNATVRPPDMFASTLQLDPVNVVNGANYVDHYDLQLKGRGMRTDFLRTYNSNVKPDDSLRFMPLGHGWTHTYNQFLHQYPDGAIAFYNDHGQSTVFMPSGNGWRAPPGSPLTLTKLPDGSYQVREKTGTVMRFSGGLKRIATRNLFFLEPGIERFGTKQPVEAGRLLSITDRNGNAFTLTYENGNLASVQDPGGRMLTFTYEGGRIATMTDPAGRVFRYRYEDDNLVEVLHPGNRKQSYAYQGHLMTLHSDLDPDQAWRFRYDTQERVIEAIDPEGHKTTFAYSSGKTVQTTYEADGRTVATEFEHQDGEILRKKDPTGTVFTYEYKDHRKVKESFNRGDRVIVLQYEYDAQGNLTRWVDGGGNAISTKFDANFAQPYEVTDPSGTTHITLDARGNVTAIRDPLGRTVTYQVDGHGQAQAVLDPGQHKTVTRHDDQGLLEHVDTPIGGWSTYTYDALGNVKTAVDPTGTRRYDYDEKGYLRSYVDQLGQETLFETDANGNVTRITAPGGRVTQLQYNKKNQLVYTRDKAGSETRYAYTALDQLWKLTDPKGNTMEFVRDGNGRVVQMLNPLQQVKTFDYDGAGNVVRMANELNEITRYAYDPLGRVVSITDPEGGTTQMEYHWIGALKRIVNPLQHATRFNVNAVGQITEIVPPAPEGPTRYHYNPDGSLARIEKPKGQTTSFTYNASGQIETVTDSQKTVRYEYDSMGRMTGIVAPKGRKQSFRHDALGRVTSVTDALGAPTEYAYGPAGELKSIRKVNGAVTEFFYDAAGKISKVSAAEGRITQLRHDAAGNLIQKVSATGAQTDYVYDALNRLVAVSELSKGAKTSYVYDAAGRMTSVTNPDGQATAITYDRMGRPVRVNAPLQQRVEMQYDAVGNLLKRIDALGRTTSYSYNANNRLIKVIDPLQHTQTFDYDPRGNLTQVRRLADGAVTTIQYNDLNLPEDVVDALQNRTRMAYDAFGNLETLTDAKGRVTRYEYDALNRVQAVVEPLGKTTRYTYDRVGNVERVTNALGAATQMVYDRADRLQFLYEPQGRTTEYRYNALDQLTLMRDANGNQVSVSYDKAGRPIRRMNGQGYSTDFFYDKLDRTTRVVDALGRNTQYAYDELSRLTRVTDALGHQTRYQYDALGNMTNLQDARGKRWTFHYDELNRMDWEKDPLQRMTQYAYDAVGNLDKKRDGNGQWIDYDYDKLGRMVRMQTADDLATFAYDAVGNLTGHRNRAVSTQLRYDDLNRLTEESNVTWGKTTRYAYDSVGRMTGVTTPLGRSVRYEYDELNQLKALVDPEGNRTGYQYDKGGRLTDVHYPSGVRTAMGYDPADQVTSLWHRDRRGQTLQGFSYGYDHVGNRTQVQESSGARTQFTYDDLDRLTEVQYPLQAILADRATVLASPGSSASSPRSAGSKGNGPKAEQAKGPTLQSLRQSGLGSSRFTILGVTPLAQGGNGNGNGGNPANGNGNNGGNPGNGSNPGNDGNPGNGGAPGNEGNPGNGGSLGNGNSPNPDQNPGQGNGNEQNPGNGNAGNPGQGNGAGNGNGNKPDQVGKPQDGDKPGNGGGQGKDNPGQAKKRDKTPKAKGKGNGVGLGKSKWDGSDPSYWSNPVAAVRYTYDEVGNRLTETDEMGSLSYTYDDANQMTRAGVTTYEYDRNGNRVAETTDGKRLQYRYDGLNQLVGVRDWEGTPLTYAYDPLGRLAQSERPEWVNDKVMRPEITRYSYMGQTLLGEWTGNGSPLAEYYTGNGETVTRRMFGQHGSWQGVPRIPTRGNHLYYLHDALGSVMGMTDHQGNPILKYREDAFGSPQAGWLDPYNTRLLTGKPYDTASGLYYFGSRWYDPAVGRFMTQDAYRGTNTDPRSMHRYAYVLNNPATLVDAWGYLPEYKPQPQRTFFDMVGDRLNGAWSGVTGMVGGMIDAVKSDPWRALAVGAGVVAVGVLFPAAVPAMISMGQTMATNYLVGQATSMVTGIVKDAASAINPGLGTLLSGLETVSTLYNAGTSLWSGAGALGALDFGNLSSLISFDTTNMLSAVTGNLSTMTSTFGVNVPGLAEANQFLGYAGMAGQFGGFYNEAQWAMQDRQMMAKYGNMYAGPGGGTAESDYWAQKSLSNDPGERALGNLMLGFNSMQPTDEQMISILSANAIGGVVGRGLSFVANQVTKRFIGQSIGNLVTRGKTVLGHYPEYKDLADSLGARRFNIPEAVWNKMTDAQRWGANQKFLDRMVSRGDDVILATPLENVRPGSYFAKELEYLAGKGYKPSADGTRLIKARE